MIEKYTYDDIVAILYNLINREPISIKEALNGEISSEELLEIALENLGL